MHRCTYLNVLMSTLTFAHTKNVPSNLNSQVHTVAQMEKFSWSNYNGMSQFELCLQDTFPKKFPHQLSPKKYGKQENSQHLLIVIGVLARHWQVSTPCDMLPSQLCLMQTDALQSVSKFKHTSVRSQSKHRQADKQLGKCPESHRTRHSSRQAKVFDVTASPTSATLKGLLILSWVILFLQPVFYTLKLPA